MIFIFIKGATAYEWQIGHVWIALQYKKYWSWNRGIGFVKIIKK